MLGEKPYPAQQFFQPLRNVILYDEHTWGAYNSIDEPDAPFVKAQWKIKQAFALDGNAQSKKLLDEVLDSSRRPAGRRRGGRFQHVVLAANRSGRTVEEKKHSRRRGCAARRGRFPRNASDRRTGVPCSKCPAAGRSAVRVFRRKSSGGGPGEGRGHHPP